MVERNLEGIYNYRKLSERIATSGQPTEAELSTIAHAGYRLVVNLGLHEADYALTDERQAVTSRGLEYVHIPVQWEQPTRGDLERFCCVIDAHRDVKVWVHCAANMRVSVFMALYRVNRLGWHLEEALQDVHALWTPNSVWQAFIGGVMQGERAP